MRQKYQALKVNILLHLIKITLLVKYLMKNEIKRIS